MCNKQVQINDFLCSYNIDVLCLSETFLNDSKNILFIDNYNCFRRDRNKMQSNKCRGGGVAVLAKKDLQTSVYKLDNEQNIMMSSKLEVIVTRVKCGNAKAIFICSIYRPPSYNIDTLKADIRALELLIEELVATKRLIIITGDLNLKYGWCLSILEHALAKNKLSQLIMAPTRGDSLLDVIITNDSDKCKHTEVFEPHLSDHKAVSTVISVKKEKIPKIQINFRKFDTCKIDLLFKELYDNNVLLNYDDPVEISLDKLTELTLTLYNKYFPIRSKHISIVKHPKSLSEETRKTKIYRDKLHKLLNKKSTIKERQEYDNVKKEVARLIEQDTKNIVSDKIDKIGFWPTVSNILKPRATPMIPFTATEINDHFVKISNKPNTVTVPTQDDSDIDSGNFKIAEITTNEVKFAWKKMKKKSSTTEDALGISNKIVDLLISQPSYLENLTVLLNSSISQQRVPEKLKLARIIPLPKQTPTDALNQLRPISILPVFAKILEKCIYFQLRRYVTMSNILYDKQFGFRPGHSTEHAELYVFNRVKSALQRKNLFAIVTLDIKKAFDTVNRDLLYQKLNKNKIDAAWFKSYNDNRLQFVDYKDISKTLTTSRGLIQGSSLSGVEFAIFINDMVKVLQGSESEIVYFADDSQILRELPRLNVVNEIKLLENDCNLLFNWFIDNDLEVNADKTELIIHCNKHDAHIGGKLSVNIGGVIVESAKKIKSLGLVKDVHLDWSDHIDVTIKKCYKILWSIRSVRNLISPKQLKILTESLCLSKLFYMGILWTRSNKNQIKIASKVFKSCVKLVLGPCYDKDDFNKLEWLDINEHKEFEMMCLAFKSKYKLCPTVLQGLVNENAIESFETRSGKHDMVVKERCIDYLSFITTTAWSRVPADIKVCESIIDFKCKLKQWLISKRIIISPECELSIACIEKVIEDVRNLYQYY